MPRGLSPRSFQILRTDITEAFLQKMVPLHSLQGHQLERSCSRSEEHLGLKVGFVWNLFGLGEKKKREVGLRWLEVVDRGQISQGPGANVRKWT